jgi:hypothetical protein
VFAAVPTACGRRLRHRLKQPITQQIVGKPGNLVPDLDLQRTRRCVLGCKEAACRYFKDPCKTS